MAGQVPIRYQQTRENDVSNIIVGSPVASSYRKLNPENQGSLISMDRRQIYITEGIYTPSPTNQQCHS